MKYTNFLDDDFEVSINKNKTKFNKNKEVILSQEECNKLSKELMISPCDYKQIFGYISKDKQTGKIAFVKYHKDKEWYVVYNYKNNAPYMITAFKRSWREYNSKIYDADERFEYVDEIPKNN